MRADRLAGSVEGGGTQAGLDGGKVAVVAKPAERFRMAGAATDPSPWTTALVQRLTRIHSTTGSG